MLLPYLIRNFNVKPIYLIRHPLAVIASQYNHKAFDSVGIQNNLFNLTGIKYQDIFNKFEKNINKISSKEDFYANWWSIDNVVALSHNQNNKRWLTLSYENLLLNPDYEFERLKRNSCIENINTNKLMTPSKSTVEFIADKRTQLSKWKKSFTRKQVTRILDIVNDYGITAYTDNIIPDYKELGY